MLGVKGINFLEAVWEKASEKTCTCKSDSFFAQDFLGAVICNKCKTVVISQDEVNIMEKESKLPTPNLSMDKLNNWYNK